MDAPDTIGAWLKVLTDCLKKSSETPALDAQTLLAHILQRPRPWLLAHPETTLSPAQAADLTKALQRLQEGQALPYILGEWEFFCLTFEVTPDVLIPRPETELLVEQALAWLQEGPERERVADVGAGSGCIGISLAVHAPHVRVLATDLSLAALRVVRRNAARHGVTERVWPVCGDLLTPCRAVFDLIVANLPYIPRKTLRRLAVYEREPALALDGGSDGLESIRRLLEQAPARLAPGGLLLLEIEASQGARVRSLAAQVFPEAEISIHPDLAGRDRILEVRLRPR